MIQIRPGSVKLCSLREVEHARFAAEAGADLFGLIFAPARRRVDAEMAAAIVVEARRHRRMAAVGVFVDAPAEEMNRIADQVGLDLLQLHGAEPPDLIASVNRPVIKALRAEPGANAIDLAGRISAFQRVERPPIAYLIDGYHPNEAGGSGVRADWNLARDLAPGVPLILAGGLDPENVGDAIRAVGPLAVDVSGGVESDGVKDSTKMRAFVAAARQAFAGR